MATTTSTAVCNVATGDQSAEIAAALMTIRWILGRWIEWSTENRAKENLRTDADTHIMSLPVPFWPSHGQMQNWIEALERATHLLLATNSAPGTPAQSQPQSQDGVVPQ